LVLSAVTYTTATQFNLGVYTVNADFDKGVLFNINHDDPNADQLQLNAQLTTFPYMWIANAGEDTISKWDTTTNREVARYQTWFGPAGQPGFFDHYGQAWNGAAPSRTAVDREGNVYVANRHFEGKPANVIKILAFGGIDRNHNGVIDTSMDLNNNGSIGSHGASAPIFDAGEILPVADLDGDGVFDPEEITDERVAWVATVGSPGALGRSLAIDVDGNIWLGLYDTSEYYKLDGATGAVLAGPIDVSAQWHTPYGAQVDGNGILWGASLGNTLLKLDTNTNNVMVYSHPYSNYGIAIGNGKVYMGGSNQSYLEFDPVTETFSTPAAVKYFTLGVATDKDGNIVVGKYHDGGAVKYRTDGSVIWDVGPQAGTGEVRGIVVDSNNDIWLIHRDTSNLSKYSGVDGSPLGVFGSGDQPYTYTDATGLTRFTSTNPSGTWSVVQDGGAAGTMWGTVTWNTEPEARVPEGTSIVVQARAADSQGNLATQAFVTISNGVPFELVGRYIEVRATLNTTNNLVSPVLSDVTIASVGGVGPQVLTMQRMGVHMRPTQIMVYFDQPLDPVRATDPMNYRIICPGSDGRLGTHDDVPIRLKSVAYDAESRVVTIIPRRRLKLHRVYGFGINGETESAVTGINGTPLAGQEGVNGTNYISRITKDLWQPEQEPQPERKAKAVKIRR
jgi:hypothetical protein